MGRLPDQTHRDRLAAQLDTSFLCLAGAGAGKTHELVERMVACVAAGVAPVDGMAAITFTRKAAGELRGRFFVRLRERAGAASGEPGARLAAAVARIDQCYIGTIHAFCAALLRQRPLEAGLSPDFSEVEQREEAGLMRRGWDRYVQDRAAAGDSRLEQLAQLGHPAEDFYPFFQRRSQYTDLPLRTTPAARPALAPALARVRALVEEALARLPAPGAEGASELDRFGQLVRQTAHLFAYGGELSDGDIAALLGQFSFASESATGIVYKRWPKGQADFARQLKKRALPALHADLEPLLRQWRQHVYALAADLVDEAVADYGHRRRAAGLVTFQDLLERAAELLRTQPRARRHLQERYRILFVDEFQDTDPLQAEIVLYLTSGDGAEDAAPGPDSGTVPETAPDTGAGWQDLAPRPGGLFVVGDEKQSIYRFRRADVEVFRRVRDRIGAAGGSVAQLTTSFRARPALCAWLNEAFAPLFAAGDPAVQAPFQPLEPARAEESAAPAVWALRHDKQRGGIGRGRRPVAEADAARIADYIVAAVAGALELDSGPALRAGAAPSPGDFLILARTTGMLSTYAGALEARGLPYDISGGGSLRQAPELRALVEVLEAVQRPDDPVALLAYLRGPLVGLADDELAAFRRVAGRLDRSAWPSGESAAPAGPGSPTPELASRLDRAVERLAQVGRWLRHLTPAAALEKLAGDSGMMAFAAAGEAGSSRAGSLVRVLALVRQWQAAGRLSHWGVALTELRALLEDDGYRLEEMTLEIGQPGAVRLMNLHQAKGLEAPVVFLADPCDTSAARHVPEVHVSRVDGQPYLAMVASRPHGPWSRQVIAEPAGWVEDRARETAFDAAEELRLVYVAATRARDALVVSTYEDDPAKGPWCGLYPALEAAPDLPMPAAVEVAVPAPPGIDRRQRLATMASRWEAVRQVTQPVRAVTDAEGEAEVDLAIEGGRGRTFGTLVHRLLEAAVTGPLRPGQPRRDSAAAPAAGEAAGVADWVAHWADELEVAEELRAEAAAVLTAFWQSPLWTALSTAAQVCAEVPFALPDSGPTDASPVVRGVIDLVYRTPAGWTIVDYKTDRPGSGVGDPAEALKVRYGDQVRAYARYWRQLTGDPVETAALWTAELGLVPV